MGSNPIYRALLRQGFVVQALVVWRRSALHSLMRRRAFGLWVYMIFYVTEEDLNFGFFYCIFNARGGAPVAREAHNLVVVGSIPAPATKLKATRLFNFVKGAGIGRWLKTRVSQILIPPAVSPQLLYRRYSILD